VGPRAGLDRLALPENRTPASSQRSQSISFAPRLLHVTAASARARAHTLSKICVLSDFLRSSGSGPGPTQPREEN
jgi:hypothetical protein